MKIRKKPKLQSIKLDNVDSEKCGLFLYKYRTRTCVVHYNTIQSTRIFRSEILYLALVYTNSAMLMKSS